jgi:hypothetical protein
VVLHPVQKSRASDAAVLLVAVGHRDLVGDHEVLGPELLDELEAVATGQQQGQTGNCQ